MLALKGKAAVIVGISEATLATATLFDTEGAEVFLVGQLTKRFRSIVSTKTRISLLEADITRDEQLAAAYTRVSIAVRDVDVLFVGAGLGSFQTIQEMTESEFDRVFQTNVKATAFCIQKALPLLAEGASVLMNDSFLRSAPRAGFGAYNASKAALRSFAHTWGIELASRRIRFSLITPYADADNHDLIVPTLLPDPPTTSQDHENTGAQIALTALHFACGTATAVNASQVSSAGHIRPL